LRFLKRKLSTIKAIKKGKIRAIKVASVSLEVNPKKIFWAPEETKESGFKLHKDHTYWGLGTWGDTWQGTMSKKREAK